MKEKSLETNHVFVLNSLALKEHALLHVCVKLRDLRPQIYLTCPTLRGLHLPHHSLPPPPLSLLLTYPIKSVSQFGRVSL